MQHTNINNSSDDTLLAPRDVNKKTKKYGFVYKQSSLTRTGRPGGLLKVVTHKMLRRTRTINTVGSGVGSPRGSESSVYSTCKKEKKNKSTAESALQRGHDMRNSMRVDEGRKGGNLLAINTKERAVVGR